MKYRSKFKHCFTNRGYLHCAFLKAFYDFQEKRVNKSMDMQLFPMFQMRFSRFSKCLKKT